MNVFNPADKLYFLIECLLFMSDYAFITHKFTIIVLIFYLGLVLSVTLPISCNGTENCYHPWKEDFGLQINDSIRYVF